MVRTWGETLKGLNEYITGLKNSTDTDYVLSLTTFDHGVRRRIVAEKVANIPGYHESPNSGSTALYDAIGTVITEVSGKLGDLHPAQLCVIITDGGNNAGSQHNKTSISQLIAAKENEAWTFVFLGANPDAWAESTALTAASVGGSSGLSRSYDVNNASAMFSNLAGATRNYASFTGNLFGKDRLGHTTPDAAAMKEARSKMWQGTGAENSMNASTKAPAPEEKAADAGK